MSPTPTTSDGLSYRRADFATLAEGLDYAARGATGCNFYSARGQLVATLPYRELRERAIALARGLIRAGFAPRSRIMLLADTDPDVLALFFACQYAGLIPVPAALPAGLGGREAYVAALARQLKSCGAVAAMAPDALVDFLRDAAQQSGLAPMIGGPGEFAALPGDGADLRPFGPDDPCYLQYSSGSTRWPLGIDVRQRSLMANAHAIATWGLEAAPGDRCVSWLPLYHDMGLVGFMLTPLLCQLSVDYLATRDFARRPLVWLSLLSEHGGTLSYSPTFGYDLCARRADNGSYDFDLRRWRAAGIGGDMIEPRVPRRFAEVFAAHGFRASAFVPSYGMAEATLAVSFSPLGRGLVVDTVDRHALAEERRAVPAGPDAEPGSARGFVVCGPALPGHMIEIRDDDGRVLPERRLGRIFVRGPSIANGYFGEPQASAEMFRDGWLDTGDLGYLVDGALAITGRRKDLIIVHGRNVWPQDLEWAVEQLPGLRRGDAAAFSLDEGPGGEGGESVVLLVQCRLTDPAARAQLERDVKAVVQQTAAIECKVVLVRPHGLPQTSSGKLSRSRARQNYLSGAYDPGAEAARAKAGAAAS
ncbi:MAG TPA: fatty acyl-AMP ligase [Geminicoccaceae bacterium]|nr:fatty acyl-AMP ligase [Geminicoccaceae bacterium]